MKAFGWLAASLLGICSAAGEVREEAVDHAGSSFRVVRVEPSKVQLVWKDGKGVPYRTFDRVQADFTARGRKVVFLMNAGIFEPGGIPSGRYVENGREWLPLNSRKGEGNFYLHPGGVLQWSVQGHSAPRITTTDEPPPRPPVVGDMAIQAGPMLLIDGKRHPAFKQGSPNQLVRNGVGIDEQGRLVFAMTAPGRTVNFWDFAGLFEKLGCKRAVFLDGDISQMAVKPAARVESNSFGAMFVIAE
ncbi:MAG: phosphodiester glycosidase family protein [Luteolibacter sp.]